MLDIDASYGEGGGQLLRTGVALSAITGTPVRFRHIRARRDKPGLAPQHLAAVKAMADICGAQVGGLALRAQELTFIPGQIRPGSYRFDIGTAGSITLVLQALLPVLAVAGGQSHVVIRGGTDVRAAPPLDYVSHVLLHLLRGMGVTARLALRRRGYYPRGGGEIEIDIEPARLHALDLASTGKPLSLGGIAHVANLPAHIIHRMATAASGRLAGFALKAHIDTVALGSDEAIGQGGALVLWADIGHSRLGSALVAERGLRSEDLAESVADALIADLACGASVDIHAADQLLIYAALADGESRFTVRELSSHAQTAMWVIGQFLPATFRTEVHDAITSVIVQPPSHLPGHGLP